MTELSVITNAEITMGVQLDSMLERHADLLRFRHSQNGISEMFPELRGHEWAMTKMLGRAVVERIHVMDDLGHGSLARDIVEARRTLVRPRD